MANIIKTVLKTDPWSPIAQEGATLTINEYHETCFKTASPTERDYIKVTIKGDWSSSREKANYEVAQIWNKEEATELVQCIQAFSEHLENCHALLYRTALSIDLPHSVKARAMSINDENTPRFYLEFWDGDFCTETSFATKWPIFEFAAKFQSFSKS